MITKQQALEFIYEISKLHVIHLDIPCGYAYIDKEEDEYRADPAYSYSTIAKFDREGFDKLETLFDKVDYTYPVKMYN